MDIIDIKEKYGSIQNALDECKKIIINDINTSGLCKEWDSIPCNVTAEEHFEHIVDWCKKTIKSTIWSCHESSKNTFFTSYGAKHTCEKKLKCYVSNNWMKLAMIYAGLEVCNVNCIDYDNNRVNKMPICISDILTYKTNFIVRVPKDKIDINTMISRYSYKLK